MDPFWWLYILLFGVAALYAGVGHGGASGYLAVMTLAGIDILLIKTSALWLNVFISAIAFTFFTRYRHFRFSLFWPFALTSIPAAYLGGIMRPDPTLYRLILGVFLTIAALRFLLPARDMGYNIRPVLLIPALCIGLGIGFLSGLIGIGGGIILSPIMLLLRWGEVKQVAAVSALFIFVNSLSGIFAGSHHFDIPIQDIYPFLLAAIPGGVIGALFGSHYSSPAMLNRLLAFVLMIAALKLLLL